MSRFLLTPAARADLTEIFDFISEERPEAARRVLDELRSAMERLGRFPLLGHLREDLADEPLRFWPVYSYLVIYRPEAQPIQIIRVVHAARDVRALLNVQGEIGSEEEEEEEEEEEG